MHRWSTGVLLSLVLLNAVALGSAAPLAPGSPSPAMVAGTFPDPATDRCQQVTSESACAPLVDGGSACVAVGVALRGLVGGDLVKSQAQAGPNDPVSQDEQVLLNVNHPLVASDTIESDCSATGGVTGKACGHAQTENVTITLNTYNIEIQAGVLAEDACSPGSAGATVTGLQITSSTIGTLNIDATVPANTLISLGTVGFIVVNEQASGTDGECWWNNGAALRVVVDSSLVQQEVIVSWVSTSWCEQAGELLTPQITTTAHLQFSTERMHDHAIVTGSGPTPTGTVTFYLCEPSEVVQGVGCPSGAGTLISTETLNSGEATSDWVWWPPQGIWCYRAVYSGDSNYASAEHTNYQITVPSEDHEDPGAECVDV